MSDQLIRSYNLRLVTPECHANVDWYRAYADLQDDITKVLPYLNSELKGVDYNHSGRILLWVCGDKRYAFRPLEIAVAPIVSRQEAQKLLDSIIDIVNDVWNRRNEITPDFEGRKSLPNVLEIYKLLSRTNCKDCGFLTCMAFAAALRSDSTKLSLCPYLSEREYVNLLSRCIST